MSSPYPISQQKNFKGLKVCFFAALWAFAIVTLPVPWEKLFGKAATSSLRDHLENLPALDGFIGSVYTCSAEGSAEADMNCITTALLIFRGASDRYPSPEEGLGALVARPPGVANWRQTMGQIPIDPWRHPYQYVAPSPNGKPYGIYSLGSDGISRSGGNDPDDVNTWNPDRPWSRSPSLHDPSGFIVLASGVIVSFCLAFAFRRYVRSKAP